MEVFTDQEVMAVFELSGINKSPARFDFKKLENISGQHMARTPDEALLREVESYLAATGAPPLTRGQRDRLLPALPVCKIRAKTIPQLLEQAHFALAERPIAVDANAAKSLDPVSNGILRDLTPHLRNASWGRDALEGVVAAGAEAHGTTLGKLAGPLRAALAGRAVSPSVFDMMLILGREETLARLTDTVERQGD